MLQNFTVENGIYKGPVKHNMNKYKSLGEKLWIRIKSHGNKIAYVSHVYKQH